MLTPETLESYMIEDEALEGIGLDSKHAIKRSPEYEALATSMKLGKKAENQAKRTQNKEDYLKAMSYYKAALDNIGKLEQVISKVPETKGFWQRLTTSMTPLFEFKFPNQEVENVSVIPVFTGNGVDFAVNTTYKTYNSAQSKATDNAVKRYYFQAMNLLKKNLSEKVKVLAVKVQNLNK